MRIAGPPQQRATGLAERVEGADEREVPQALLLHADPRREVVERPERAALALLDDHLGLRDPKAFHLGEAEPDVMCATRAMRSDRDGSIDNSLIQG